jgi:predicted  nucleic acid-binding Zn-ribbon protein
VSWTKAEYDAEALGRERDYYKSRIAELEAELHRARQHIEWLMRYVKGDSSDAAGVVLNARQFLDNESS